MSQPTQKLEISSVELTVFKIVDSFFVLLSTHFFFASMNLSRVHLL